MIRFADLAPGPDGLVPAIVQDATTRDVAMMAWMNAEALERTQETGIVHFWSRSRGELWRKGSTSGNTLEVRSVVADCDGDTLLVVARPTGPVCHTGATTCFDTGSDTTLDTGSDTGEVDPRPRPEARNLGTVIDALSDIIDDRRASGPADSYTARLIADPDLAARKVLEEAGEVAFAVKDLPDGGTDRVTEEAADVVYHLLALLASVDVAPDTVAAELVRRMANRSDDPSTPT
jgi:phosphoribosyl-ATP pyrophosphohydrolase/phosphoribosyl-AMP cyclohydrolase